MNDDVRSGAILVWMAAATLFWIVLAAVVVVR